MKWIAEVYAKKPDVAVPCTIGRLRIAVNDRLGIEPR
jgi:hypothetical protein